MPGTIGLKLANGEFFSIMEEKSTEKKRLILTTVHDNQKSVQIDLYKSMTKTMTDASYIGTIVVENIAPKPKGEPSIETIINPNDKGNVTVTAVDLTNPIEEYQLNVSLESYKEDNFEYPDFDADYGQESFVPIIRQEEDEICPHQKYCRKKFPLLIAVITGLGLLLAGLGILFFLVYTGRFGGFSAL